MANGVTVALPRTLGRRLGSLPIAIGGALGFVLAYGLLHAWKVTFGFVFLHLAAVQISIPRLVTLHPFGWLAAVNGAIEDALNDVQRYGEKGMVWGFNNFIQLPLLLAGTVLALGLAVFELGEWTATYMSHHLPRVIHQTIVRPIVRPITAGVSRVAAQVRTLAHRLDALRARVDHVVRAVPHAISTTIPRVGRLERQAVDYVKLHRWIKRALSGALGAAIVLSGLKRLGLGWVRCRNVTRAGKALCGMNPALFESLLGSALLVTSAISLRDLARELEEPTALVADALHTLIREV